jgi:glutathione S-transferase
MPVIEPGNSELKNLQGIHLWHAGMSTCSQRVRITLAELGQSFESHIIDLHGGENASESYQQINPKGVVPAMVHDGTLLIESVDIIAYLDDELGSGTLRPGAQEVDIARLLKRADAAQSTLKLCTFEFLFRATPPLPESVVNNYQKTQKNETLRQFHRDFHAGFERSRIEEAVNYTHAEFQMLDDLYSDGRQWLAGDDFSLADIAWMPNFHRFDLLGWPFDRYPNLSRWFIAASARDSYRTALEEWEPKGMLQSVAPKLVERRAAGNGIETYGQLAN